MQEYLIAKQTVEHILGIDWKMKKKKDRKNRNSKHKIILADSCYGE